MNVSLAGKVYLRAQQTIKPLEDRKKNDRQGFKWCFSKLDFIDL